MPVVSRPQVQDLGSYGFDRPPTKVIQLSANESALPPLPGVLDAVRLAAAGVNRYPAGSTHELKRVLAERLGIEPKQVVIGAGSAALFQAAATAFITSGDAMVVADPTFDLYERWVQIMGGRAIRIPLDDRFVHDLDAMASAVGSDTRAIVLCNPNNPTGTAVAAERLSSFIRQLPSDVLVIVDEAYREFAPEWPASQGAVGLAASFENLLVLRTFSKAYGLAGLRVGYAVGSADVVGAMRNVSTPAAVTELAIAAAIESLRRDTELAARVATVLTNRSRVTDQLRSIGLPVVDSSGNFVWMPLGALGDGLVTKCETSGIRIRPLAGGVRVTIGSREENERFLAVAERWWAERQERGEELHGRRSGSERDASVASD